MNVLKYIRKYKRIWAAVIIVLLTVCVEIGFNYPAIRYGQTTVDLSGAVSSAGGNNNKRYVVSYEAEEVLYVKQIRLIGDFSEKRSYTINTVEINPFGKEEESTYSDVVHAYYSDFYTNLNKRVKSIEIEIPYAEGDDLNGIILSNFFEINKYRVTFFFAVFLILYSIIFEKFLRRKIQWFFVVFTVLFGTVILLCAQPVRNSWDEANHFAAAYRLASGRTVQWTEATDFLVEAQSLECNTKAEFAQLRHLMDEKGRIEIAEETGGNIGGWRNLISYFPMALFLKVGMMIGLPFSELYLFGKIGNLLFYIIAIFWAIRLAKRKKLFLAFIAMMPTSIFLAASYTYDSVGFALIVLGSVFWGNEMFCPEGIGSKKNIVAALLLLTAGSLSKLVYLPLTLGIVLLPQCCKFIKRNGKFCRIVGAGIAAVVLVAVLFVLCSGTLSRILNFADIRGGNTNIVAQMWSMVTHPLESIRLFVSNMLQMDNFRNTGSQSMDQFFIGNLLFLNYHQWGVMDDKWSLLLVPVLVMLLLYRDEAERKKRKIVPWKRVVLILCVLSTVFLIWVVMYLAFTPVGDNEIIGVQPRYYLPVLYFAALLLRNRKVYLEAEYDGMANMTMAAAFVLEGVSVYGFGLTGRLF